MDIQSAREWIVKASLIVTGIMMLFFLTAPAIGFPLLFEQAFQILGTITPVFVGYIGAATQFIFKPAVRATPFKQSNMVLLGLLMKGPIYLYAIATLSLIAAFWYSNRPSAETGGMSIEVLGIGMSITLALLAGSTHALVTYLFQVDAGEKHEALPTR